MRAFREGERVTIGKGHPWAGHSGIIIGSMTPPVVGFMWKVRLDNGMEVGAKPHYLTAS